MILTAPAGRRHQDSFDEAYTDGPLGEDENRALLDLFSATNGAKWKSNKGWATDTALVAWEGIKLDRAGQIIKLVLPKNNLSGFIPETIDLPPLSSLRELDLRYNQLTGPIPEAIGQLTNLTNLHLHCNRLTGG